MDDDQQQSGLTDVALCYQVMGVPLDASPVEIGRVYMSLTGECKRKLSAQDEAVRREARENLELLQEIYRKIQCSVTYRAFHRDYVKNNSEAASPPAKPERPAYRPVTDKRVLTNCPRCNGSIAKGVESCPVCKAPLRKGMGRRAVFCCITLSLLSLLLFGLLLTGRLSELSRVFDAKPEIDFAEPGGK